jgi:hypothetical protein
VLTNHLKMQEDEAKVLQAKKRAGNATGSMFAYPLGQSIPSTKEDKLPRIDRR